jgi:hypothetical protein
MSSNLPLAIQMLAGSRGTAPQGNSYGSDPRCGCDRNNNACSPAPASFPAGMRRGYLPLAVPMCPGDRITQPGRINGIWVPDFVFYNFFARGSDYSPVTPVSAQDTKIANTPLVLTLAPAAGSDYLFPGVVIDLMTSDQVAAGIGTFSLAGTFENGDAYTQTFTEISSISGRTARYVILFTREVQGGAYPSLVRTSNNFVLTQDATAPDHFRVNSSLTISTSILNPGTVVYAEMLSPVSDLWNQVLSFWYNSAQTAGG